MALPSPLDTYKQRMRAVDRRRLLRPLTGNQTIDIGLRAYQSLAKWILPNSLVPSLLAFAGLIFISTFVLPELAVTSQPENMVAQAGELGLVFLIAILVALPLITIGIAYSSGLTVSVVSDFVLGNEPDFQAARQAAQSSTLTMTRLLFGILFRALGILLISGVCLLVSALMEGYSSVSDALAVMSSLVGSLGLVLGFAAIPVVLSRYALCPVVAVLERVSPKQAYRRSVELMKSVRYLGGGGSVVVQAWIVIFFGSLLLIGGFGLLFTLFDIEGYIGAQLSGSAFVPVLTAVVSMLPTFLALWIITPIWTTATTVLYYERRVRLEAFDIETLNRDLVEAKRAKRRP